MDLYFIFIQIIGILAWLSLAVSYYRPNTDKILVFQIAGTLLYCLHYYLLGAYSGLFICIFEVIADYGYYKTNWDNYIYIASIPARIIGGLLSYETLIDTFPIAASLIDGYSLTKQKKLVVIGAIISYTLWVIYDIGVKSYSGVLTDGMVVLSNIYILLFQKENKKVVRLKKHIHFKKVY